MPAFLIPILIIVGIFAVTAGDDLIKSIDLPLPDFRLFPERVERDAGSPGTPSAIGQAPPQTSSPFTLDTVITQGPREGDVIENANAVTFEFEGSVAPADTSGRIAFETRVQGVDKDWVQTSSRQRKITLPAGPASYVFEVRSKLGTGLDATPAKRSFSISVSPSFGNVTLSFRRATNTQPFLATLTPRLGTNETLSVSEWSLRGNTGNFALGYGTDRVRAIDSSFAQPIVVSRGDRVFVSGAASPFGSGGNFRPNACFGWLAQYYSFPLPVPSSCPDRPSVQEISYLAPACQDFILKEVSFSRCQISSYSQSPISTDSACVSYINSNLNYESCVARHSGDSNFLRNEWQVFANRSFGHPTHDVIRLVDENGLLVDEYVY